MNWCKNIYWNDEIHKQFFVDYRHASEQEQSEGLISQAECLSNHLQDEVLKVAESLLTLWMSKHFQKAQEARVYICLAKVYRRLGEKGKAQHFTEQARNLESI